MGSHTVRAAVVWGAGIVLLVGLTSPPAAMATDNSYTQATGGLWTEAGNWSLGHIPTSTETPVIVAGSTANKIVSYNSVAGISYPSVRVDGNSSGVLRHDPPDRQGTDNDGPVPRHKRSRLVLARIARVHLRRQQPVRRLSRLRHRQFLHVHGRRLQLGAARGGHLLRGLRLRR